MKAFYETTVSPLKLDEAENKLLAGFYTKTGVKIGVEYAPSKEPVPFNERLNLAYKPISIGEKWGDLFDCAWFHFTGKVTDSLKGKKLALLIDLNGEGCVYDKNGSAIQGLTCVNSDYEVALGRPGKREYVITENSNGDEEIDLFVDGGCNDLFGYIREDGTLKQAELVIVNDEIKGLYYDFWVLRDLTKAIDKGTARYSRILLALDKVCNKLHSLSADEISSCREILHPLLEMPQAETGLKFYATGHAHLDLGWLWPVRESKRKAYRTFSTALKMMEKYPFYVFGASQPQQFEWVKENDPVLFSRLQEAHKKGQLELQGAFWVESDLNLTSGESLVRQIVYGQRFWKENFGVKAKTAHLPDVFGFTGALPQILKACDIPYLLTIKINWNRYNVFPYNTFHWQGIDGSKVLVHIPPERVYNYEVEQPLGIYNSRMAPASVFNAERDYADRGICSVGQMLYGIGDGGGGPGEDHLERLKRVRTLNGISPVVAGKTAEMFDELKESKNEIKTYYGELYLERHQGTFTSQAKIKYYNTLLQNKLRDAEFYLTASTIKMGKEYPQGTLDKIWKEVLLYQFHDILPGSSIARVYKECFENYEKMNAQLDEFISQSKKALGIAESKPVAENIIPLDCGNILETATLRAEFNENGELVSLFDKKLQRETLKAPSNLLLVYNDRSNAWDMPDGYLSDILGKFRLESVSSYANGEKVVRVQTLVYGQSKIEQTILADSESCTLRFDTKVDWKERLTFLKTAFSFDVFTDYINCGCAFGNIKRNLTKNTKEDLAKVEISGQRYVDLSAGNHGVAMFSDCKYGWYADKEILHHSLLRGTENPGKNADYGRHEFSYAIYSHDKSFENSDVTERAYAFACGEKLDNRLPDFLRMSADDGVILEAVKLAYDGAGVVLRICEERGVSAKVNICPNFAYKKIYRVTPEEEVIEETGTELSLRPFEMATLKIV